MTPFAPRTLSAGNIELHVKTDSPTRQSLDDWNPRNDEANKTEGNKLAPVEMSPDMYWEFLWNTLHVLGWTLKHSSYTDISTGHPRHLVHARRGETEIACSAPSVKTAVTALFEASKNAA